MTYQSELVSPITDASGVSTGTDELRGQVMAADDDDDMTWLEDVQDPRSEEGDRRATRGVQRRPEVQSMGRSFPDIIVHHQRNMTIQLRPVFVFEGGVFLFVSTMSVRFMGMDSLQHPRGCMWFLGRCEVRALTIATVGFGCCCCCCGSMRFCWHAVLS